MCARGVAQQPPRRTNWFDLNLPLYSPGDPEAVVKEAGASAVAEVAAGVTAISPSRRGEKHAEVARLIGPPLNLAESRAPQQRDEIVRLVLVGILGMDAFAGPE